MRAGAFVLVLVLLASACASPVGRSDDPALPSVAEIGERLREVERARYEADRAIEGALAVVRRADDVVRRARSEPRVEATLDRAAGALDALGDLDPEDVQERVRELATAVDETRAMVQELRGADERVAREELDAHDVVLRAVRVHAAAGDTLLQLVDRHGPTYRGALEALEDVRSERDERAEDDDVEDLDVREAVEDALAGRLESLTLAREELARFRERREESRQTLAEVTADAAHRRAPAGRP